MAVVNQQLEDDNNHGAGGSASSIDEIASVNASKEAEMERVIRLYLENMWPMIHVNQSEEHNNHGAGGSTSSIDELTRVSASTRAEMERLIRICKETLWPMICAEMNEKQHTFFSVIKEKFGLEVLKGRTRSSGNKPSTSGSPVFQFQFLNGISTPVSTRKNMEGKDHKPLVVALVDRSSGQIVTTGAEAAIEFEIVVLEDNCNDFETENWTSDEFNNKIVKEWKGKKVLQGTSFLKLKEGVVSVNKISFTHNSAWKENRICRLGARPTDAVFANRIKEGKTESFPVVDKRKLLYNKHPIPSSFDQVFRLNMISRRSACFNRLSKANIKTVMDLRALHAINPKRLKDILKVHHNTWKVIMNHAEKCKDDNGIYLYPTSTHDQKRDGVVFNVSGHLVGLVVDSLFLPSDKLSNHKMAAGEKLVVSASEHWGELKYFKDEASLINHLQSTSTTTLNSVPNGHNLPKATISPIESHWKNNFIVGVTPTAGQSSQSLKRPASEHAISNSPKKRRDEIDTEEEDFMQYLNFSQAQKWKTSVWCVVRWISIFSKVRNPSTVTNGYCSPIQHVQI